MATSYSAFQTFRNKMLIGFRKLEEIRARKQIRANDRLWKELENYRRRSNSTGCNVTDYWYLYSHIRAYRPVQILECGPGVSTVAIAVALLENEQEGYPAGTITSMEEEETYFKMAKDLFPESLSKYVEFHLSSTVEDTFSIFRGVRYRDVPDKPYDFVFVDGPRYVAPSDEQVTFDFDLLSVLQKADIPVRAIIDKRVSTCFVLQSILGSDRVQYSASLHLGFVQPTTRNDLKPISPNMPSEAFLSSFRVARNSKLAMNM